VARTALLCLARSIWVPWTPPSKRSCPTVAYLIIGGSGADALSQTNRDRAVYRADAAAMGVRAYMSSADKPSPPIGNAAAKVFAADADRFLTFLWELQGCNVDRYRYSKVIIPAPNVALPSHSPGARLFLGNEAKSGTCITQGPISRDPTGTIEVFLKSPGVDIFIVYFSGPSTADGDWVFPHRVINYDDMLVLWTSAMTETIERNAYGQGAAGEDAAGEDGPPSTAINLPRLVIVSDSSLSGRWVKRARETCGTMLHMGGGNVAVQASCGDKELAYQHTNAGGCFTSMFCSYGLHGNSWRTLPDPKVMQQVSAAGSAVAARDACASVLRALCCCRFVVLVTTAI
jgi:hypothetical protein